MSEINTPEMKNALAEHATYMKYLNELGLPAVIDIGEVAPEIASSEIEEVIASPCRPATVGMHSVNSAKVCPPPVHVAAWTGGVFTPRSAPSGWSTDPEQASR